MVVLFDDVPIFIFYWRKMSLSIFGVSSFALMVYYVKIQMAYFIYEII